MDMFLYGMNNKDEVADEKKKEDIKKSILSKTAKEYFDSAEDEFKKERYNSSIVLYFKALIALIDLYVFQNTGKTPSSHNDRFRTTQEKFPEVYDILDKDFPFYQDSYIQIITKELTEVVKNDAKIMAGKTRISL